jgi:hypothetical protein
MMGKFIWNPSLVGSWEPSHKDDVDYERDGDVCFVFVPDVGMVVFQSKSESYGPKISRSVLVPGAIRSEPRQKTDRDVWEVDVRPLNSQEIDRVRTVVRRLTEIEDVSFW